MSDIDTLDVDASEQNDVEVIGNEEPEADDTETAEEKTPSDEEEAEPDANDTEAIAIAKAMKRYGCNEKAAKVIREQAKFIGRQADQIGQLRKQPESATPGEDEPTPEADDEAQQSVDDAEITGIPEFTDATTPSSQDRERIGGNTATPTDADTLPETFFTPPARDWRTDPIDPATGYPIETDSETGERFYYEPHDPLGIPFKPETYWQARAAILSKQYADNPVYASQVLQQERNQANQQYQQQFNARLGEAEEYKTKVLGAAEATMAQRFGKEYPENVAKGLAHKYADLADRVIKDNVQKGQIPPHLAYSKGVIELAIKMVRLDAYDKEEIEKDIQAMMKPGTPAPKPKAKPMPGMMPKPGTKGGIPPTGGSTSGGVPAIMTADQKKKYGAKNTVFDD